MPGPYHTQLSLPPEGDTSVLSSSSLFPSLSFSPPVPPKLHDDQYKYMSQLLSLEACTIDESGQLPDYLCRIVTPLKLQALQEALQGHPDQAFAEYILQGTRKGFRIGCERSRISLKSCSKNRLSAMEQLEVVENYLGAELQAGQIVKIRPQEKERLPGLQCSPFGVIPKKNRPGKWRPIVDLSVPDGHSVNESELTSLSYVSVNEVVIGLLQCGKGAAKVP